ncbi:MFS transporter [Candidatus Poribacteria bacterium]|nr:MFS transporter [Candidatus Poribacteria bacterium]
MLPDDRQSEPSLPPDLRRSIYMASWTLLSLYNVGWAILFPLRAIYFREPHIGLSWEQIGWLGFVRSILGLAMPLVFGSASDRSGRQKVWLLGGFACASVSTALFLVGKSFLELAVITAIDGLSLIAYNVNLNALVTATLDGSTKGRQFGQFRIAGSIGYAFASFILVPIVSTDSSYRAVFLTGAGVYLLCLVVTAIWVRDLPHSHRKPSPKGGWKRVLNRRNLKVLYACQAISSIGGSMCFQFFSNHLNETYHLPPRWVGIIYGIMTLAEIPTLILLGLASDRWGRKPILLVAFFSAGFRWTLIGFAPGVPWIVFAQLLWGLGFSGFTVGVALMTDLVDPEDHGSAFGILNLAFGVGNVVGPPLGGYIAEHLGLPYVFRIGGSTAIIGGIILAFLLEYEKKPTGDAIPVDAVAPILRRFRR